jgi:hypothetical protein
MFRNYRSYYNKEPEQCCNPLSSFENKQKKLLNY